MDTSEDSMKATYDFLDKGNVSGAKCLPIDLLVEQIDKCVKQAIPSLRQITLPTIVSQVAFDFRRLSPEIRKQPAFMVYALGNEAWLDVEVVEYWFVDRTGTWYWIKCNPAGRNDDYSIVNARHLAERHLVNGSKNLAHIGVLAVIAGSFRTAFNTGAEQARNRANDLQKVIRKMEVISFSVSQIVEP